MRFRWHGTEFAGELIRTLENGAHIVRTLTHGSRFAPGTEIEVQPNEVVSLDAPADAPEPDTKALDAAMAAEREALPSVKEVIADPNPTQPLSVQPVAAPQTRRSQMADNAAMARIKDKARLAAGATAEVATAVEAALDDILAKRSALLERNADLHKQHAAIIDQANAGLDTMEDALRQLTNGGPA
jgi:hypothetical protein